jgi:hypothetical protein
MKKEITFKEYNEALNIIEQYNKQKFEIKEENKNLLERRKKLKYVLRYVSSLTDISISTISRIENGETAQKKTMKKLDNFYTKQENKKKL